MPKHFHDFLNHPQRVIGIAQELAAAIAFGDFVDRAAHVDVDDMRPAILGPPRGFAQQIDVAAIKLHAQRAIFGAGHGQLHRPAILAQNALRAEKIGARQPHAAAGSGDQAKRQIAVPGDWGEQQIGI
jgi:hypothetical protein